MGHLDHAAFGWLTPAPSYVMACIGAARGCAARSARSAPPGARAATGCDRGLSDRHRHLDDALRGDARLQCQRYGNALRRAADHPQSARRDGRRRRGVFAVGYGRDRGRALVLGGLTTGLGVASMHYLGMAALRLHGVVRYDPVLVGLSVVIAVVAATAALWAALNIRSPVAVAVASLVMGGAVSSMHYTGMMAVSVRVSPSGRCSSRGHGDQFIFPLAVGLGSYLFLTSGIRRAVPDGPRARGIRIGPAAGRERRPLTSGRPEPRRLGRHAPNHSERGGHAYTPEDPCSRRRAVGPTPAARPPRPRGTACRRVHRPRRGRHRDAVRGVPRARDDGAYVLARYGPRSSVSSWCRSSRCSPCGRTPR